MEKESIIMRYIAVWNWHLLAMMFLISSILSTLISEDYGYGNWIVFLAFFVGFVLCEAIAYSKKNKLEEETEENNEGNV